MKKLKNFFATHNKISYFLNFIISLLGIIILPDIFMPNFQGFILSLILTMIILNLLGLSWKPLLKSKNI